MKAKNNSYYIAWSIKSIKKGNVYQELENQLQKAFKTLINKKVIKEILIYKNKKTIEMHEKFEVWDYLVLIEINKVESAKEMIAQLNGIKFSFDYEIVRLELLVTTPESTYPIAQSKAKNRIIKPFYAVEYVSVKEEFLDEFRNIMISNNGPAMKHIMEHKKWCYNFYALETVTVFYHNEKYPLWNQIHVIGLYIDAMIHYKKDFQEGLRKANDISFEDNFSRLRKIRIMRYKTMAKKVVEIKA